MRKTKKGDALATAGVRVPEQTMMLIGDLNMAPYNPRIMPAAMMASLKASLVKHGLVLNLVAQKLSPQYGPMVLIGGHQRVVAIRELCREHGWDEPLRVPVTVLDVGDPEAKQLNVALNNIEGEFDPFKLGELFASIQPGMTMDDVLATGFRPENIDQLVLLVAPVDDLAGALEREASEMTSFASSITLSVEFDTVEQRDAAKELLRSESKDQGKKAGVLLLRALKAHAASRPRHKPQDGHDRGAGPRKKARAGAAA